MRQDVAIKNAEETRAAMEKLTTGQLQAFLAILEARQDNDIERANSLVYELSEEDCKAIVTVLEVLTS